ncbi:hypothetical protein [Nocardia sp. NPDC052566]|uniref:hypothetical protein n=1 Tax=Nocardia sp. NPDC052566 TaxID=3364330 RepID=UPI0037C71B15
MATIVMLEALAFGLNHLSAAARRREIDLVLLTFDRDYYRRQLAGDDYLRVVDVDTLDIDAVHAALDALGEVSGLISNTDTWAHTAATLADKYGFPNVTQDVSLLRDKVWVRNRVADAGLSAGRGVRGSDWAGQSEHALHIVKDAEGTGSKHVRLADGVTSVAEAIAALRDHDVPADRITVEPYAYGPLYSAETFSTESGTVLLGINSRTMSELPQFRELDLTFPFGRGSRWEAGVAEWVAQVLAGIDRGTGFSHVEFVDTADGPELVEVNARLGGGLIGEGIRAAGGIDPFELLLLQATEPHLDSRHLAAVRRTPATGGYAQVLKYASKAGTLGNVLGAEDLARFPGDIEWHPLKDSASSIESIDDQRACYGFLTATGPSPETALHRAHAAARHLRTTEPGVPR